MSLTAIVALFTRAWIEIPQDVYLVVFHAVALFTRAWIEICVVLYVVVSVKCRPLYEGVD